LRSYLANDSGHLRPESTTLAVDAGTAARFADVLTREASGDNIDETTPASTVESVDVWPDREWIKEAIILALHKNLLTVIVDFDSAHSAPAKKFPAEDSATGACEECELTH
jgi:hypothetical protein